MRRGRVGEVEAEWELTDCEDGGVGWGGGGGYGGDG